jgi:hypothetical protein
MYWFKSAVIRVAALITCVALAAISPGCMPDVKDTSVYKYFDLKKYMSADIARLQKLDKAVIKTVYHNGTTETETVHIGNWGQELGLFTDADINKPAWKKSYKIIDEDSLLVYRTKDTSLTVRELIVKRSGQKVKYILIYTKTKANFLYKTTQRLTYFPDSLYEIVTEQKVRLMRKNVYKIRGVIGN